jgi:hypothetical protein
MTFDELSENLEDYLKGEIIRVEGSGSWHSVWLNFNDWDGGDTERCIQLVFTGVAEAHCRPGNCWRVSRESDHPVLWNHQLQYESVYCSKVLCRPSEVIGRAYEAHGLICEKWREFRDYWVASLNTLESGYGLLFRAPTPIVDAYCAALEGCLSFSRVRHDMPKIGLSAFLLQNNFVIAREVSVHDRTVTGPNEVS